MSIESEAHCLGMLSNAFQKVVGLVYTGSSERALKAIGVIAESQGEIQLKIDTLRLQILQGEGEALRLMRAGHTAMARAAMANLMKMRVQLRKLDAAHTSLQTQIDILDQSETNHMLAKTFKKTAKAMRKAKAPSQEELDKSIAAIEEAGEVNEGIADEISAPIGERYSVQAPDEDLDAALAALMERSDVLEGHMATTASGSMKHVGVETERWIPHGVEEAEMVPAGGSKPSKARGRVSKDHQQAKAEADAKIRQSVLRVLS